VLNALQSVLCNLKVSDEWQIARSVWPHKIALTLNGEGITYVQVKLLGKRKGKRPLTCH